MSSCSYVARISEPSAATCQLLDGERSVEQQAAAAGSGGRASSHHLHILRSLRLVRSRRAGRHVYYTLHEHHIADLLAAVRHHHEHVYPGDRVAVPDAAPAAKG